LPDDPKRKRKPEPDEIDKFLSTLPSLRISDDMIDDKDFPKYKVKPEKHITLTGIFVLAAWFILLYALLTFARAAPPRGNAFHSIFRQAYYARWNMQYVLSAMFYLFGNCAVCLGGLAICLIKKIKLTSGTALNLWIAGALSLVLAFIFLGIQ
jgi:hypothetical protein